MGNQVSTYPERMLAVRSLQQLNDDIDEFNNFQLEQKVMDALGFLVQFQELNQNGLQAMFKNIFFQTTLANTKIKAIILLQDQSYDLTFNVMEMYRLAELLGSYSLDAFTDQGNDLQMMPSHLRKEAAHQQLMKKEQEDEDKLCPLCLDQRVTVLLPCLHGYCESCERKWIHEKQQKSCPMCRFHIEQTTSKLNRVLLHLEDDASSVNKLVRNDIYNLILSKNNKIPLKL